ncbi:aryl-sulfate sulfotransferase [Flavobacteriales bacterium]|nr:aryl-sulfate sulfotransferase [Flavobacteriales bacterium]
MKYLFSFVAFLCTTLSINSIAQNFNRPITSEIFPYEFQLLDSTLNFYYALGMYKLSSGPSDPLYIQPKAMILDSKGYNVWYGSNPNSTMMTDFKYDSASNHFFVSDRALWLSQPTIMDTNFNIEQQLTAVNATSVDSHDFKRLANGNYAILGTMDSIFDLSAFTFNGNPGSASTNCKCNLIEIVDPNNNLLWEWNSCNYLHPSEGYDHYGYNAGNYDYAHFNSFDEDYDGHYLVSFRHLNAIVKINSTSGEIIWRLGGKLNDFTFANDTGFSGQHSAERRPSGYISLLDNGNMSASPLESRAVEYELDTMLWEAILQDEYTHSPSVYGRSTGSYYRWNNSKIINFGRVFRPAPSIVTSNGINQLQALAFFQDSVMSYRVHPFQPQFSFNRPEITCLDSAGTVFLAAEAGYSDYLWSSGETVQLIEPIADSTYQVWVPHGIGKISSKPVFYTASYCSTVNAIEVEGVPPHLIRTIDLLGRAIETYKNGQIYLEIYSDGTTKKICYLKD